MVAVDNKVNRRAKQPRRAGQLRPLPRKMHHKFRVICHTDKRQSGKAALLDDDVGFQLNLVTPWCSWWEIPPVHSHPQVLTFRLFRKPNHRSRKIPTRWRCLQQPKGHPGRGQIKPRPVAARHGRSLPRSKMTASPMTRKPSRSASNLISASRASASSGRLVKVPAVTLPSTSKSARPVKACA